MTDCLAHNVVLPYNYAYHLVSAQWLSRMVGSLAWAPTHNVGAASGEEWGKAGPGDFSVLEEEKGAIQSREKQKRSRLKEEEEEESVQKFATRKLRLHRFLRGESGEKTRLDK